MRIAVVVSLLVMGVFAVGCSDRSDSKPRAVGGTPAKPDPKFVSVSTRFDGRVHVTGPRRMSRDEIMRIAETNGEFLAWRQTKLVYQSDATAQGGALESPVVEPSPGDGRIYVTVPSNMPLEEVSRLMLSNDAYRQWLGNYLILDRD